MINSISGWIAYRLYKLGVISEEQFTIVDYHISVALFVIIALTTYIGVGVLFNKASNMVETIIIYNLTLNCLNEEDFHASTSLTCGIFTGVGIFTILLLTTIINHIVYIGDYSVIYTLAFAILVVEATLSKSGKSFIRKVESIILKD